VGLVGASEAGKTTLCLVASGLAPRIVGGTLRGRVLLEMEPDLLVQLAPPASRKDERPEPLQQVRDHSSDSRTRRMPSTAAAVRRQAALSASSWRRPLAVSA